MARAKRVEEPKPTADETPVVETPADETPVDETPVDENEGDATDADEQEEADPVYKVRLSRHAMMPAWAGWSEETGQFAVTKKAVTVINEAQLKFLKKELQSERSGRLSLDDLVIEG